MHRLTFHHYPSAAQARPLLWGRKDWTGLERSSNLPRILQDGHLTMRNFDAPIEANSTTIILVEKEKLTGKDWNLRMGNDSL